jgi:hypothetical protein
VRELYGSKLTPASNKILDMDVFSVQRKRHLRVS